MRVIVCADQATPGPWQPMPYDPLTDSWDVMCGEGDFVSGCTEQDARLIALAPDLARLAADMADALDAMTFENYRGIACSECGWNASNQPPEVTACLACGGELVARIAAREYTEHSDALLVRLRALGETP